MAAESPSLGDRARALAKRLDGALIPAVPVPRSQSGAVDPVAQETYARWMAREPVAGVAVWAHTGRGLHLDDVARRDVLGSWRRALSPPAVIIAGCGAPTARRPTSDSAQARTDFVIDETVRMAREARAGGADAVLVHPPGALAGLRDTPDRVIAVHEALRDADAPVLLFLLYERASNLEYDDVLLDRLLAMPHVVGLKVATLNSVIRVQDVMRRMASDFPDRLRISGEDRFLGYSLMVGARAALIGMGAARPAMQARLIQAVIGGDWGTAAALTRACDRFAAATFVEPMEGYVQRMLWALAFDTVIPDAACHDPHGPVLARADRERVHRVMRELEEYS